MFFDSWRYVSVINCLAVLNSSKRIPGVHAALATNVRAWCGSRGWQTTNVGTNNPTSVAPIKHNRPGTTFTADKLIRKPFLYVK
jgi:hypothetical protein